jgi:hypothetical protein
MRRSPALAATASLCAIVGASACTMQRSAPARVAPQGYEIRDPAVVGDVRRFADALASCSPQASGDQGAAVELFENVLSVANLHLIHEMDSAKATDVAIAALGPCPPPAARSPLSTTRLPTRS